jgi:hypothetical protein
MVVTNHSQAYLQRERHGPFAAALGEPLRDMKLFHLLIPLAGTAFACFLSLVVLAGVSGLRRYKGCKSYGSSELARHVISFLVITATFLLIVSVLLSSKDVL